MTYIINNALEWANFRECLPLEHSDIIALGSYFKVKIPKRFDMFEYSYNPNHVRSIADTPSSEKIIFNTLSTLKAKILKKFDENKVENRGHKKGVAFSDEHKFNQSISSRKRVAESGSVCGYEVRPVVQLSKITGNFIEWYSSSREATLKLNKPKNRSDIISCCKGLRNKKSAFKFKWMFLEDYEELKSSCENITVKDIEEFIKLKYHI